MAVLIDANESVIEDRAASGMEESPVTRRVKELIPYQKLQTPASVKALPVAEQLAAACAEKGDFARAVQWQQGAVADAEAKGDAEAARAARERLARYEAGQRSGLYPS